MDKGSACSIKCGRDPEKCPLKVSKVEGDVLNVLFCQTNSLNVNLSWTKSGIITKINGFRYELVYRPALLRRSKHNMIRNSCSIITMMALIHYLPECNYYIQKNQNTESKL